MPYFSIIIPTYNSSSTILNCIRSILEQTFIDFEILIIDNISSDNTLSMIESLNEDRIKIISEKDFGVYDAMNKGIKLSEGSWLYFLGSDDKLYTRNTLLDIFEILKNDSLHKLVYGNVLIDGDTSWAKDSTIYDGFFSLSKILSKNISHQSIFFHQSVFNEGNLYNINYKICADWDFCLKCFSKYNFIYIDQIIAIFSGGGMSTEIVDSNFQTDRWRNVLRYFGIKSIKKEFRKYNKEIYNSMSFISPFFLVKIFYLLYRIYIYIKNEFF